MQQKSAPQLLHLDFMRGIAVLLVLLYHLKLPFFENGYLGVDMFFVLSGYLMMRIYGQTTGWAEVKTYWTRRLWRLLPAYIVVTVLTIIAAVFLALPHELYEILRHNIWSSFGLANIGYWFDSSYFESTQLRPLLNFWSLGVEVQFYLIFPLLLIFQRRFKPFMILAGLVSFVLFVGFNGVSPKTSFFLLPFRLWEFVLGAGLVLLPRLKVPSILGLFAMFGLLAVVLACPVLDEHSIHWLILASAALSAVVIYADLPQFLLNFKGTQFFYLMGKYSYSIYLLHFPIIIFMNYQPFAGNILVLTEDYRLFLTLGLILSSSIVLYHLVENPFRRLKSGVKLASLATGFAVSSLVLLISYPFLTAFVPKDIKIISEAYLDRDEYRCGKLSRLTGPFIKSCLIGNSDDAGKNYLLVGNSHADSIKQSLSEVLNESGSNLWIMRQNYAVIDGFVADIVGEVKRRQISTVVIHAAPSSHDYNALAQLVTLLEAEGVQIAFIKSVPTYGENVLKTLYQEKVDPKTPRKFYGLSDFQNIYKAEHEAFEQIYSHAHNMHAYDPLDLFCRSEGCDLTEAETGKPLYFDSNHLTLTGSDLLKPIFRQLI